ncbi:MAG: hypothetical protein IJ905_03310 [Fibrobacter sp.]|nr:hypothetical protein [Fibrobacter sp.]
MRYIERPLYKGTYPLAKLATYKRAPYDGKRVKVHLVECYGFRCCYCETPILSTTTFQVDHFYPQNPNLLPANLTQSQYNSIVNHVKNYHLSCPRCNVIKSNKLNNISPNYYYDFVHSQWELSRKEFYRENLEYRGPYIYPVNNSSLALQFITNLNLNGLTDSESDGLRLALIDQRSAYLIETQILLQSCYLLMNAREYNGAAILLLYVGARFREDAPYSTMIVDNYGPQLYAMLCKLKLKVSTQSKVLIKSIIHSILR